MKTRPNCAAYNPPGNPGSGPSSSVDAGIWSLADLAAVSTINLVVPAIRIWIMAVDGTSQIWRLLASSADTGEGVQRPNDYNAITNAKVWFKASS